MVTDVDDVIEWCVTLASSRWAYGCTNLVPEGEGGPRVRCGAIVVPHECPVAGCCYCTMCCATVEAEGRLARIAGLEEEARAAYRKHVRGEP